MRLDAAVCPGRGAPKHTATGELPSASFPARGRPRWTPNKLWVHRSESRGGSLEDFGVFFRRSTFLEYILGELHLDRAAESSARFAPYGSHPIKSL
jgi:hypothetical protein